MALTDTKVRSAKPKEKEYSLVDGDGMFLLIHPNGSKYWQFRFRFSGKTAPDGVWCLPRGFAGGCPTEKRCGQKAGGCRDRSS